MTCDGWVQLLTKDYLLGPSLDKLVSFAYHVQSLLYVTGFRVASKLVPTILMNYPSKHRRSGRPLTCPSCSRTSPTHASSSAMSVSGASAQTVTPLHSQSHIMTECIAVSDLRAECNPEDDTSLAVFFRKVVARHMEMEDELFDQLNL